ncbi:Secondary metabolism regulator LAE1 [Colletotrichum sp. SAR 10_70]|nr:Secondary metabolism regulator LAE1 [Colletotrichum sp. SAR 10_71]KAI8202866.1 Secondary metabolism regulator LAE1 [Colletotrichum sp. SAR 10_70]KAI8206558.1 Secondary metabolism regulator LAE1 [Colletotrichum sp. SAR 10_65]KAI8214859.1 Secondary metabolism regulator LAE1 [Colletotrichum sp. SAR 10_76]KAI8238112.1 Secondary metabolism regulator LAE1 [Colletotrichum sp. SAR 10_86]KAJ5007834.1 Secondary metabolism regulator LAE1 [Colletotrichum sp. SAR 10_66]
MATPGADSATTAGEPPEFIEVGDTATPEEASEPEDWDARSSTSTSLASGIQRHAFANGRRYHAYRDGRYPIPNDETEQNREDMKHAMVLELSDGKLFHAPIGDHPQKIIDLGTGTGIWAMEVGDQYPGAEVTGADLSPIQPDCNLKPGAWVETQDFNSNVNCDDGTMPDDWALIKFWALLHEAMLKLNVDIRVAPQIGELMEQAGFVNVRKTAYKVPIGTWPRNNILNLVGEYMRTIMEDLLGAAASKPLKTLGMTDTEIQVFLVSVRSALRDRNVHAYGTYYSWVGQKPLDA